MEFASGQKNEEEKKDCNQNETDQDESICESHDQALKELSMQRKINIEK